MQWVSKLKVARQESLQNDLGNKVMKGTVLVVLYKGGVILTWCAIPLHRV